MLDFFVLDLGKNHLRTDIDLTRLFEDLICACGLIHQNGKCYFVDF